MCSTVYKPAIIKVFSVILILSLMLPQAAHAKRWGKDTKVHELFGGKYIFEIDEHFEVTDCNTVTILEKEVGKACFKYPGFDNGVNFTLTPTSDKNCVREFYNNMISNLDNKYHEIYINNISDSDRLYQDCMIFCQLKDEFYEPGKWFEYGDGSVSPYWQVFFLEYKDGYLFTMSAYYNHDQDWVGSYRGFFNLPIVRFCVPGGQYHD